MQPLNATSSPTPATINRLFTSPPFARGRAKSRIRRTVALWLVLPLLFSLSAYANDQSASDETGPERNDGSSLRIIQNYLVATGGPEAHEALRNVVATGVIKESTPARNFRLIETRDGRRHLILEWKYRGRRHKEVYGFDGLEAWKQIHAPEFHDAMPFKGLDGEPFANHTWLLKPLTFESITANEDLSEFSFLIPASTRPTLRQRTVDPGQ